MKTELAKFRNAFMTVLRGSNMFEHKLISAYIITWGSSYWFVALLKPGLIGNIPKVASMISMILMGVLIIGNLILNWKWLWALLGIRATYGMVASWIGFTQWAVPYSEGTAAVSMAVLDVIAATVFWWKFMNGKDDNLY